MTRSTPQDHPPGPPGAPRTRAGAASGPLPSVVAGGRGGSSARLWPAGLAGRAGRAQEEVRRHNLSLALSIVHGAGSITRSELTERMGLSRSTIKALVAELVALGVLTETGTAGARAGAGRPSLIVRPHRASAHVLAADVGVDRVVMGAYGLGGGFAVRREGTFPGGNASVTQVVGLLRELADDVLADPATAPRVLGLSVAIPAIVTLDEGLVRLAPNLGWVDEPLGARLRGAFSGMRVLVGNDSDLGAVGEHLRGAGRGVDDLVYVHGDVGIGAGFVLGGRPVVGAAGYAGEVGHVVTAPDGRTCRCGVRGCWETEVGASAIAAALGCPGLSVRELRRYIRTHEGGDPVGALAGVARAVGRGVGTIVNLLNPRRVVLGGLLRDVFDVAGDRVEDSMAAVVLRACAEEVTLVAAGCGEDAVLVGAAETLWQRLLVDPAATLGTAS